MADHSGTIYISNLIRTSKNDPVVDEVELLHINPTYAWIKKPDGRETSISHRNLARYPGEEVSDQQNEDADDQNSTKETGGEEHGKDNEQKEEKEENLQPTLKRFSRTR